MNRFNASDQRRCNYSRDGTAVFADLYQWSRCSGIPFTGETKALPFLPATSGLNARSGRPSIQRCGNTACNQKSWLGEKWLTVAPAGLMEVGIARDRNHPAMRCLFWAQQHRTQCQQLLHVGNSGAETECQPQSIQWRCINIISTKHCFFSLFWRRMCLYDCSLIITGTTLIFPLLSHSKSTLVLVNESNCEYCQFWS
jgi:hypothetical protein